MNFKNGSRYSTINPTATSAVNQCIADSKRSTEPSREVLSAMISSLFSSDTGRSRRLRRHRSHRFPRRYCSSSQTSFSAIIVLLKIEDNAIRIFNDNGLQWYESEIMATKIIELGLEIETRVGSPRKENTPLSR